MLYTYGVHLCIAYDLYIRRVYGTHTDQHSSSAATVDVVCSCMHIYTPNRLCVVCARLLHLKQAANSPTGNSHIQQRASRYSSGYSYVSEYSWVKWHGVLLLERRHDRQTTSHIWIHSVFLTPLPSASTNMSLLPSTGYTVVRVPSLSVM